MEAWPLVGREAELDAIAAAMDRRASPGISGVVLAGPPGVGKTRLAREALHQAREGKAIVEWVVATQAAATIPFGPVAHLLPHTGEAPDTLLDLLRRTADGLAERARGDQVVLGVDDAHLLDGPSAALVHHLALSGTTTLLLTLRGDASAPDAITGLWKDGLVERLDVRPFSLAEVEQLLGAAVGGQVEGATVRKFWELCQGNALFLIELVAGALDAGALAPAGDVWRASGQLGGSTRLAEVIRARLGRVGEDVRAAAEVIALGEPLGAALLEAVVGGPALEATDRAGLIEVIPDARRHQVRLAHPLYSEQIRATVPPLRRRAICRQLADALGRAGARRSGDPLRLAVWQVESGAVAEPSLLTEAARLANRTFFDHALAERLAHAAVDAGGGARARRILAQALFAQGRADEAAALLAAMERAASGDDRAQLAVARAHTLFWGAGQALEAERALGQAEDALATSSWRDEGRILRATIAFSRGRTGAALQDVAPVLAEATGSTGLRALTLATGAWAFSGRAEHAATVAEAALAGTDRAGHEPSLPYDRLRTALCVAYRLAGLLHDADRLAADGYQGALDHRAPELQGPWALLRGENALARGEVEGAHRWLREAASLLRERSWFFGVYSMAWCLGSLAEASALLGDVEDAAAAMAEADAATPEEFFVPPRERGRIWVAAAQGELSKARDLAAGAARMAAELGSHMVEAVALHDVARLGGPAAVVGRLSQLATQLEGRLPGAYATHAAALAANDGPRLAAASTGFEQIGVLLLAAEAAAETARAYDPALRNASAFGASRRSRALLAGRPIHTPALALPSVAMRLTPREREVATLVAQGLSNREIGRRLGISERTAANHVQRIFTELDLHRREDLAALFRQDPGAG